MKTNHPSVRVIASEFLVGSDISGLVRVFPEVCDRLRYVFQEKRWKRYQYIR